MNTQIINTKVFILVISLFISLKVSGQSLSWQWASTAGGVEFEYVNAIKTDSIGNTYVFGRVFSVTSYFESYVFNNTNASGCDVFLAKYNLMGGIEWVKGIKGSGYEYAKAITIDPFGNIFVTGTFDSPSLTIDNLLLLNTSGDETFIVKFNSLGNAIWAKNILCNSSQGIVSGNSIASDKNGNVIVTGSYSSDTLLFGNLSATNSFPQNFFILKIDSTGNPLWMKVAGEIGSDYGICISTDSFNNIYVSGGFSSSNIIFGNDTLSLSDNLPVGLENTFLVKYDLNGNVIWTKQIKGISNTTGLTSDNSGNSYWVGSCVDSGFIDSILMPNSDIFIIKINSNGELVWITSPQGSYSARCNSISIDTKNRLCITGDLSSGTMAFGSTLLQRRQAATIFLARYDSAGQPEWGIQLDGGNEISSRGISNDSHGNIYLTGIYRSTDLYFDSISIINNLYGSSDIFIAKLHESLVSVNEILKDNNQFTIYPNPIVNTFKIKYDFSIDNIILTDIIGREIFFKPIENEFRIENLNAGIYIIQIYGKGKIFSKLITILNKD
jgi:hypothetical protein